MKRINHKAVRAVSQALLRSDALRAAEHGAECDAMFDGGEWSNAFSAVHIEAIESRIVAHVARRFGMLPSELRTQMQHAEWDEAEKFQLHHLRQAG
jgi:hypothetical protein